MDAANLTGVHVDWFLPSNNNFSPALMAKQIHDAANSGLYDGLFLSIPNSEIASAVMRVSRDQAGLPIVVVNVGQQTATQMGYLSVLQNDTAAGEKIGYALYDKGNDITFVNLSLSPAGGQCEVDVKKGPPPLPRH